METWHIVLIVIAVVMVGIMIALYFFGKKMQKRQAEQDEQVVQDAQEALKTQGKKGMKMPRINMAFSPSNIDFVRVMAALKGQTMTQYVNALLDREREANGEAYEAAKKLSTDL